MQSFHEGHSRCGRAAACHGQTLTCNGFAYGATVCHQSATNGVSVAQLPGNPLVNVTDNVQSQRHKKTKMHKIFFFFFLNPKVNSLKSYKTVDDMRKPGRNIPS